jgi:hypothetical protein
MDDKGHAGLYNLSAHYEQTVNRGAIEIVVPFAPQYRYFIRVADKPCGPIDPKT